jgi:adenine-specific DNA methylase
MKEPIMIACPHCGKETPAVAVCRNCGKDIEFLQGLEVQYRDFKGSEMLDIKMSSHRSRQKEKQTSQKEKKETSNGSRSEKKQTGKKTVVFFWVAGVIILSALAWYYLLKFLPTF